MSAWLVQVVIFLLVAGLQAKASRVQFVTTEVPLGEASWHSDWVTDDYRHVAAIVQHATNVVVHIDTEPGKEYDAAQSLEYSADNSVVAYVAFRNQKAFLVVNGREGKQYDDIAYKLNPQGTSPLAFSLDNHHLAYVVREGFYQKVVLDDKEGKSYERILPGTMLFSPDSKHFAYIGRRNTLEVVNLDRNELTTSDEARAPIFSPDGNHFAYAIRRENQWHFVFDGVEGPAWDGINPQGLFGLPTVTFSEDSRHFAYEAVQGEETYLVVDGQVMAHGAVHNWVFGPKGHTAYVQEERGGEPVSTRIVADGMRGQLLNGSVGLLKFMSDGRLVCLRQASEQAAILTINDEITQRYQGIAPESFCFGADGNHIGFLGANEKQPHPPAWIEEQLGREPRENTEGFRYFIVRDGKCETVDAKTLELVGFNHDLSRWAAVYETETNQFAIVDGKGTGPYKEIGPAGPQRIAFSPDGRHFAFEASTENGPDILVVDGEEKAIDGKWDGEPLIFDTPTHLRGLFSRTNLIRLEVDLRPPKN